MSKQICLEVANEFILSGCRVKTVLKSCFIARSSYYYKATLGKSERKPYTVFLNAEGNKIEGHQVVEALKELFEKPFVDYGYYKSYIYLRDELSFKVSKHSEGDDTRQWGPPFIEREGDRSAAYFHATNRGKRSVTCDFRTPEGQETVPRLVADADVVIENFKVGGLAKYGLEWESLRAVNPRLVYCSITGFGQTGPYAHRAGYDFIIQVMAGLMSVTGEPEGQPQKVGVSVTDVFTGVYAATAILAALVQRGRTGEGQHIYMALMDVATAIMANQSMNYLATGTPPRKMGNAHPNLAPYAVFDCADGWIILATGNDGQYIPRNTYDNQTLTPIHTFTKVWVSGTHRNFLSISAHQNSEMLVIQFKPTGAFPFLHCPIQKLNDKVVSAEVILGKEILELRDKILLTENVQSKFELVTNWLLQRFDSKKEAPEYLLTFTERLQIEPLSNLKNIVKSYPATQKQLIEHFKKYVGLTPKYYHRILRFNEILKMINQKEKISWTDIAYRCDYSDQSHFIKEFSLFSRFNPMKFIKMDFPKERTNFFPWTCILLYIFHVSG